MNLETVELRVPTGSQDYLAALHGASPPGITGPTARGTNAWRSRRAVAPTGAGLTGQPRHSGFSNWDMFRRTIEQEAKTVSRMEEIARIARELREALVAGDLDAAGRLLGEEGRLRYRLAPSVGTPLLRAADRAARRAGALGVKVCGAGGGGCLVAFAREGRADTVRRALAESGAQVLDAPPSPRGLRVQD
jgi:D-glycero-alpha-D-manno-heptose-7-phosphate kinase